MIKILQSVPSVLVFNSRNYARFTRKIISKNPGIQNRLDLMKEENLDIDNEAENDIFDDASADFNKLPEMDRQYEKDVKRFKEFTTNKIIEQKYFESTHPNLLTWSEKEQIRFLHENDPEEWTAEKISESFPIIISDVKKLIKVTWKPANENRIARHDASAIRNWKELKEGTLKNIPPELRERLLKFSNRVIPPRIDKNIEETARLSLNAKCGEFSSIITGYQIEAEKKYKALTESNSKPKELGEENTLVKVRNSRIKKDYFTKENEADNTINNERLTLEDLRLSVTKKLETNENVTPSQKHLVNEMPNTEIIDKNKDLQIFLSMNDKPSTESKDHSMALSNAIEDELKPVEYLERINIPKAAWKKGGTYKVDDCYYDDDGEFLYRVPGLTKVA